jgi:predicted ArsR family transcriptional regulator
MMTLIFNRARSLDPATSHAAADQAQDLARQHFELIVGCLQRFGARGKDGIAELTGLDGNQVARRMKELEKDGRVELTGRTTKSKSGRSEREWRFVPVQRELI